jgi:thiosulfate/3-mercaptopyruvate sulfurtransferase
MTDLQNHAADFSSQGALLSSSRLAGLLADADLVDVSDPVDFEARHIAGAKNIPLFWNYRALGEEGGLDGMAERLRAEFLAHGIDGGKPIVFTEQNPATGFGRSCRAWFMGEHLGVPATRLHVLDGGNQQWQQAGLPLEGGSVPCRPAAAFPAHPGRGETYLLSKEAVLAAIERGAKLLDVRNLPEFLGQVGAPYAVIEGDPPREIILPEGRIPGTVGLSWTDVFEIDGAGTGRFKSSSRLAELFGSAGLAPDDEIIVYCFKGARACAVLFALHLAGFKFAKSYFAGWNEWAREEGLPRETGQPGPSQLAGSYAKDSQGALQ